MKFNSKIDLHNHIEELVKSGYLIRDEIVKDNPHKGGITILKCFRVNYRVISTSSKESKDE